MGFWIGIIDYKFDKNDPEFLDKNGNIRITEDSRFSDNVDTGHGTEIAKIIGGKNLGIAPEVKMIGGSVGIFGSDGVTEYLDIKVQVYTDMHNSGVRIFNQSFGIPTRYPF